MAQFKIEPHSIEPGRAAVNVFDDAGEFVATVVWRDGNILVVSKYIQAVMLDKGEGITPPVAMIHLKPAEVQEHKLVGHTLTRDEKGIVAQCVCGWASTGHFSSMAASAAFRQHQDEMAKADNDTQKT